METIDDDCDSKDIVFVAVKVETSNINIIFVIFYPPGQGLGC